MREKRSSYNLLLSPKPNTVEQKSDKTVRAMNSFAFMVVQIPARFEPETSLESSQV
ncbi:uncharacterized protein PHALS_05094 [Plasmopara halstedii]|uniref:Uncharacterized protein n=1 Tax=Plasmopara halstedii TaxID=4781 RepID=A0A0P1B1V5_PLAHL|nr:uncharacterized protein PHALS_05094 [Plasmopara halstedii]CEG47757.1 hypothetical protein PHALS_05094 [Plasmopara halstedii]|eukprot:XP_024584126.1 hypothetical protein PHALS_05094 [Plasmopara halstedii]